MQNRSVGSSVNVLGDIRAERDREMLELAFYSTPDYRTLIESTERPIVVGRRGTGKSALCYQLGKYWKKGGGNTTVRLLIPEEDQVIGLRGVLANFANKYNPIKAWARMIWKYGLLLETTVGLIESGKLSQSDLSNTLVSHVQSWRRLGITFTQRVRMLSVTRGSLAGSVENTIASLMHVLQLNEIQRDLIDVLSRTNASFVFLIDQLDEGFEPDELGVGLVGGFVHAAVDVNHQVPSIHTNIFLRDNIFKSLAHFDPDYSKNIEGRFLRLHWDEYQLFDLVCARLRVAFHLEKGEANRKIWNSCTANALKEMAGFERCLRHTLYRPRDVLSLLNEAFYSARRQKRTTLILEDVESTAREVSNTRFDDLIKEYAAIIPGLQPLTAVFRGGNPEMTYRDVTEKIGTLFANPASREFAILEGPQDAVRILYSVGFLGIKDHTSSAFVFCHDGREPGKDFEQHDRLLVHPCYWMALGLTQQPLGEIEAAEIHDEYEVEVFSEAPAIRNRRISQLESKLAQIQIGEEGAGDFEEWCLRGIKICFSGPLRNIQLHPNKNASARRDVVASNQSEKGVWRRVLDDYKTRQVIFEVKNKRGLEPDDYRQMLDYLQNDYGRLGFIITRDDDIDLAAANGTELQWTRRMYHDHDIIVVKLTGRFFASLLLKLRGIRKQDPADQSINKLLDTYTRLYLTDAKLSASRAP